MTHTEFNSLNNPEYRCYAVYDVTFHGRRYIERAIILSTILHTQESPETPIIQIDNYKKRVCIALIKDIIVSRIKWLPTEKMNIIDLVSLDQEDS